jgi:hypothetical protein
MCVGRGSEHDHHGRIPWTADRLRIIHCAVTPGSLLVSSRGRQYCPELRIPLSCATGFPCQGPGYAWAAGGGDPVPAAGSAVIAWYVFMMAFLFTIVNTQYGKALIIYPDLASGFAAIPLASYIPAGMVSHKDDRIHGSADFAGKQGIISGSGQLTIVNFRVPAGSCGQSRVSEGKLWQRFTIILRQPSATPRLCG